MKTRDRIDRWYEKGARLINVIKITTEGMIPAILTGDDRGDLLVWVSQSAKPKNGQPIALAKFCSLDPSPEIFISMSQVYNDQPWGPWWHRTSYQEDKWFIGHAVPKARVVEVLPCTGTNMVSNDRRLVTEYLFNSQYWWEWTATIWRRTRDYKLPNEEVSADDKPQQPSWFELEEKDSNGGDARSQRMSLKKRGCNPEWEDSHTMTNRSKKTLTQHEQDQGAPGERDLSQPSKELATEKDEEGVQFQPPAPSDGLIYDQDSGDGQDEDTGEDSDDWDDLLGELERGHQGLVNEEFQKQEGSYMH